MPVVDNGLPISLASERGLSWLICPHAGSFRVVGILDNGISYIMQKVAIAILVLFSTDRSADSNKLSRWGRSQSGGERKGIRPGVPILLCWTRRRRRT